ncbi:TetR/AcrR family transcriptional regulator [Streptomyces sp. NPDC051173]|uniref:TetR/AcrR family transcriptional regulator n=1 Tax=Streptomyces sp. NPDC051173 TaxID=3155164 RepID=UPI00344B3174
MRDEKKAAGCRVCKAPLPRATRGRPPAYCSRGCQAKAYRQRKRPPVAAPEAPAGPGGTRARRRREIAEAVWRIAAGRGLHEASMREIATEAGVSLRVVQYHFTGKHELLVSALRMLHEENERRARARVEALRRPDDPRALLRAILDEFLPLDEHRLMSFRVFAAYYARSLTDPELAAVFLHGDQPLEELVAAVLRGAREAGRAAPGIDPSREADLLVSGITGLGMDIVHTRRTPTSVSEVMDYHLDRLLPVGAPGA